MKKVNKKPELTPDEKELFEKLMPEDVTEIFTHGIQRKHFLKLVTLTGGGLLVFQMLDRHQIFAQSSNAVLQGTKSKNIENGVKLVFRVNGANKTLEVDSRMTLLDTLRERLELTGSKKGCDHGQCGACTVITQVSQLN